jgi:hypothetical protein
MVTRGASFAVRQSVFDPSVRVVTYPVEVANGEIAVTIPS